MKIQNKRLIGQDGRMVPFVKSPNFGRKLTGGKPRFLIIHYTAGGSASGTINYFQKRSAQVSAHFVIGRDGAITQMVPLDTVGWHAGRSRWKGVKGVNSHSIGIELANYGKLKKTAAGTWVSDTGSPVPDQRVILDEHKNRPGRIEGWEAYTEAQFTATVGAAQAIVQEYGLKEWDVVGHDDISPGRKIDPGPAFEMDAFRAMVFGRSEDEWDDVLYKVRSTTGLNLRKGPSTADDVIINLGDGTVVHVIDQSGKWWLVAVVKNGADDVTGYVHSHWLEPQS
ncbi:MAG: N-acetylmuramoyl-L-alanine amidase [Pikeienuella sp.]